MNENVPAAEQRDLRLRRARRARIGVLWAGVLGSLGVAAAVAVPALQAQPASAPGTAAPADDQPSFSQWQTGQSQTLGDDGQAVPGRGEGDDGGAQGDDGQRFDPWAQQQQQQSPPPGLQPGQGPSHGSTGGS